ncbi:unnamed protein product, partial [Didymodactylos carnosus]
IEEEDIDQVDQSPVGVQTADARLELVELPDGSELDTARVTEGYVMSTSNLHMYSWI